MLKIGNKAPSFKLPSDAGTTVSLTELKGKKVVLYFYPKDDTTGCTKEACSFRDAYDLFLEKGAVVVGISADNADSHGKFRSRSRTQTATAEVVM
jgi:peroxiredoxin Q/BCP